MKQRVWNQCGSSGRSFGRSAARQRQSVEQRQPTGPSRKWVSRGRAGTGLGVCDARHGTEVVGDVRQGTITTQQACRGQRTPKVKAKGSRRLSFARVTRKTPRTPSAQNVSECARSKGNEGRRGTGMETRIRGRCGLAAQRRHVSMCHAKSWVCRVADGRHAEAQQARNGNFRLASATAYRAVSAVGRACAVLGRMGKC